MASPLLPDSSSELRGALPWLGALVTGMTGFFAARYTAFAQLSKTVLDASRELVERGQETHALDGARILELEAEVRRLRGEVNQHIQKEESYQRLIERMKKDE